MISEIMGHPVQRNWNTTSKQSSFLFLKRGDEQMKRKHLQRGNQQLIQWN